MLTPPIVTTGDGAPFFVGTVQPTADASASIPSRARERVNHRISGNRAIATGDDWMIPKSPLPEPGLPLEFQTELLFVLRPGEYRFRRRPDGNVEVVKLGMVPREIDAPPLVVSSTVTIPTGDGKALSHTRIDGDSMNAAHTTFWGKPR